MRYCNFPLASIEMCWPSVSGERRLLCTLNKVLCLLIALGASLSDLKYSFLHNVKKGAGYGLSLKSDIRRIWT